MAGCLSRTAQAWLLNPARSSSGVCDQSARQFSSRARVIGLAITYPRALSQPNASRLDQLSHASTPLRQPPAAACVPSQWCCEQSSRCQARSPSQSQSPIFEFLNPSAGRPAGPATTVRYRSHRSTTSLPSRGRFQHLSGFVCGHRGLSDFQAQATRVTDALSSSRRIILGRLGLSSVRGEMLTARSGRRPASLELAKVVEAAPEHPFREVIDQAGVLNGRDEPIRREQAHSGVILAD